MENLKEKHRFQLLYADLIKYKVIKNKSDLAYRLGVTPQSIGVVLTDGSKSRNPSYRLMTKAIEKFNLHPEYFTSEDEIPYTPDGKGDKKQQQNSTILEDQIALLKDHLEDKKRIIELLEQKIKTLEDRK